MINSKCYGYVRVSSHKQIDGTGFERQEDAIRKYCRSNSIELVRIFREQVSGTKDEASRPVFYDMMAEIIGNGDNGDNGVKTVIVESLDRLARSYGVQEHMLVLLASKEVGLIRADIGENVTEAMDEHPMKKATIQMQGVFGELDKSLIVRRLRKGREKVRKETGECEGPKRYGYDPNRPAEAEVLKEVRYMRRKKKYDGRRRTFQSIADELNDRGIPTRLKKKWSAALVFNILKKGKKKSKSKNKEN